MKISARTLAALEWPDFLKFYSSYVASPAAREQVAARVHPVAEIEQELKLAAEALRCAERSQIPSLSPLEDCSALIEKGAVQNALLEGIELLRIGRLAALNNEIRGTISGWKADYPLLFQRFIKLPDLRALETSILSKIETSGEIKEDATPELSRIRREMLRIKSRLERALERYLKDNRYRPALQEEYVTYRHGRAVLLIRSEQKNAIRGFIHGESGSGASVFVEPLNVLELNNELAQLNDRQLQEINRLLRELTSETGRDSALLLYSLQQLIDLDLLLARGRFGKAQRCVIPEMTADMASRLIEARHPLLESALLKQQKTIVPLTFEIVPPQKALIVTGPNTGGKTVFLKTAGLLSLMAHCAIPVPAAEGSSITTLTAIEADIGDQQSISESLSTFSSHISNIVSIFSRLQERSLILLDELGTGTDPEEGAPLAVAILQELLKHEVLVLVTSHHAAMKMFAVNHPQCLSAAMEFDESNLQPTYRVLIDQIGASHAFEIASRLGLSSTVLESARKLTKTEHREIQEFQTRLQERIRSLEAEYERLRAEKSDWEARAQRQQHEMETVQNRLQAQLKKLNEQNTDLIRTLNAKFENLLDSIRDAQLRQRLRRQYKEEVAPAMEEVDELTAEGRKTEPVPGLAVGDRVWVNLFKDFGQIQAIKKDQAELLIRNKRFTVPLSTLEKKEQLVSAMPRGIELHVTEKEVARELNLIGQRVEDALEQTDKYLDDAFLNQLPEVRLIHGHGTGRLKKAIEEMLNSHPHVRGFHPESQQRGGSGVTVVELKSL